VTGCSGRASSVVTCEYMSVHVLSIPGLELKRRPFVAWEAHSCVFSSNAVLLK